jgi:predicted SAM-dependent methyltransferase
MGRFMREEIMERSAALFPIVPTPRRRAKQIINIRRLGASLISALPIGLGGAAKQLAAEVIYRRRHLKGVRKARKYRGRERMAMHLGCGNNIKDGWVNIDLNPQADLTLDARERLPFEDNTFRNIYSEGFLEHLDYPRDITKLLSECYRVLEPGGINSFAVPDGEKVLRYYITQQYADFAQAQKKWNPAWCRTQMDHVNYCMRQDGEHRWYYDEETMRLLLESVGFVEIQRREFDPKLDQEVRRVGLMYMQCAKPKK